MTSGQNEKEPNQTENEPKVKVFVSGCYDILHGGHIQFFTEAKELGDYLIVSFASDAVLAKHKAGRRSSIPTEHKKSLISSFRMVDEVVVGEGDKPGASGVLATSNACVRETALLWCGCGLCAFSAHLNSALHYHLIRCMGD